MEKNRQRKVKIWKFISTIVMISFIVPIVFCVYKIAITSNVVAEAQADERVRSDYVLMLLECIVGVFAMLLPGILTKRLKLVIPDKMYYLYVIFLYGAIFLGEVTDFYYNIPYWDTILHAFSSTMTGLIGFSLVHILHNDENRVTLSPFFIAFFAFCFAVSVGVFWEFYEYSSDGILGTNMQKFQLKNGVALTGRSAVSDTMEDLIVDVIGAFLASTLGYISIKYKKGWLNDFRIKIRSSKKNE